MPLSQHLVRYRAGIIGLAILIILIAGFAWFLSMRPDQAAPQALAAITVTPLQTDVFIKQVETTFAPVNGVATTTSGSTIRTSSTGRALISSASSHTTLVDYSSEIVLSQDTNSHTSVSLLAGAVWSRLAKTFDSGEYYEIKSGNAIAAVRGTSFGVWYAGGTTTLIVTDGSVLFSAIDPATGLVIPGTQVLVTAGKKAVRNGNGAIVVTDSDRADLARPWVVYNTGKDAPVVDTNSPLLPLPTSNKPDPGQPTPNITPDATTLTSPAAGKGASGSSGSASSGSGTSQPTITSISPSSVEAGASEPITLTGKGLQDVRLVEIGKYSVRFTVVNASTITFTSDDVGPGTYDINISAASGATDSASKALTITQAKNLAAPNSPSAVQ